nr:hypothetical protein [Tanacetum cinerariifolium]
MFLLEYNRFQTVNSYKGVYTRHTHVHTFMHTLLVALVEQAPPSPDYVPGPKHADDEIVAEDQLYAEDVSPTAQSPKYVLESDLEAHPEDDDDEDPEED